MSQIAVSKDEHGAGLDHILLGCADLEAGIAYVEQSTGVRAMIGGVHPGRGTKNAVLSLGPREYLEIIAPDPNQTGLSPENAKFVDHLKAFRTPAPFEWAAHVDDIEALAGRLEAAGVEFEGPNAGSRNRPDGRKLHWKTLGLRNDFGGLLPFFIEWGKDSVHPSVDSPKGCRLESFVVMSNEPTELTGVLSQVGLSVPVQKAEKPRLRVRIAGPNGAIESD